MYSRYPPNWKEISRRIRYERANGHCEWCCAKEGSTYKGRSTKVRLAVAHLGYPHADGSAGDKADKADVRDCNLAALCQRCHLNFDRQDHQRRSRVNRERKARKRWEARGYKQLELFA